MSELVIYKISSRDAWLAAVASGTFQGSADDLRDGYIHFSTRDQLAATLAKHFAGQTDLMIIAFDASSLGPALKWEASRGGALFPHLYAPLDVTLARQTWLLAVAVDGVSTLPEALR